MGNAGLLVTRNGSACARAISALGRGLLAVKPGLTLTDSGYVDHWNENLIPGIDPAWFEAELNEGDGRELDRKFRAAHSSSALAVNTFARFKTAPHLLSLVDRAGCETFRFEAKCSAEIEGRHPPNLDLLAKCDGWTIGVESKCTEHLKRRVPRFAPAYNGQIKDARRESAWFRLMHSLLAKPHQYCHLDAAQLVKHAFGLGHCFPSKDVTLLYLYWEPRNAGTIPELERHREEIARFAEEVAGASPSFRPVSYRDLWQAWERLASPPWLAEHVAALRARYDIEI